MAAIFMASYTTPRDTIKANPHTAKRLAALKAAQDHLDRNAPLVHAQIEKAIGDDWRKVQMLRKATSATKKAFGV